MIEILSPSSSMVHVHAKFDETIFLQCRVMNVDFQNTYKQIYEKLYNLRHTLMCTFLLIFMFRTYLGNFAFLQTFSFSVLIINFILAKVAPTM